MTRHTIDFILTAYLILPKRQKEAQEKMLKMISETLGESAEDMVNLHLLATAPECQGQGYGSSLVKFVTDIVSIY